METKRCQSCGDEIKDEEDLPDQDLKRYGVEVRQNSPVYEDIGKSGWFHSICIDIERGIDDQKDYELSDVDFEDTLDDDEKDDELTQVEKILKNSDKSKEELLEEIEEANLEE